jgi:predicted membrane-bound dolichyl-phosphate-mannose-protein mannosyltransferase
MNNMETGYIKIIREEGKALVNGTLWVHKYEIAKTELLKESDVTYTYRYTYKGTERQAVYYNLEMLIFLSYRIATFEAQIFRRFIGSALREHLQKEENRDTKLFWYFKQGRDYLLN